MTNLVLRASGVWNQVLLLMLNFKKISFSLLVGLLTILPINSALAIDITGAGASFPYPIYAKWAANYYKYSDNRINYQSIGSGGGQQQIIARTVDFGASDDPMSASELKKYNLLQFPTVIGAIVPIVNLKNIAPGELKFTGAVLADIFLGKIKRWDDPQIQELNPEVKLPNKDIVVVHRSDGSGTTYHWTNYLSQVSPAWHELVGEGKAVKWPVGHGGKGNEGVAAYVSQLENTIGYVEYAFAHQNNMTWVQLQNISGNFVKPTPENFKKTLADVDWAKKAADNYMLNNLPGEYAWPITVATFVLVPKNVKNPVRLKTVLNFFEWAWDDGQQMAIDLDFVPLPASLINDVRKSWQENLSIFKAASND